MRHGYDSRFAAHTPPLPLVFECTGLALPGNTGAPSGNPIVCAPCTGAPEQGGPLDITTRWIAVAVLLAAAVLAVAVAVFVRLVRARRGLRQAGLPTGPRWVFWGALAYFFLPADLVPDPVYLDDIGVLLLALRTMRRHSGSEPV